MDNVQMTVTGDKLVITVDLTKPGVLSSTGKTKLVASTRHQSRAQRDGAGMRTLRKTDPLVTFEMWLAAVDKHIAYKCGMSHSDLDDSPYHDWYDDRVTPAAAARRAISNSGG